MSSTENFEEEETSLFELWAKLREGGRWMLGGALIGGLGAGALLVVIPPTYQASALLQTGKVAGAVIEDVSMMVERLKSPSFLVDVAKDVEDQRWLELIEDGEGAKVLTAQVPKTSPSMVEVKVRARSPEYAKKIAEDATAKVIKRQDELSAQAIKKINFDLAVAKEKLVKAEQDLATLNKTLGVTAIKDERFSQVSLLTTIKLQKESEVFALRQSVFSMEISLLPPSTQPAKVLEAIYVSQKPTSPKKGLLLALGLVGGGLFGVMWVFASSAWRQARERRSLVDSGKA